jgi:hypothetical protein
MPPRETRPLSAVEPGDALVIPGVGTYSVHDVGRLGSGELLIALGWDRLAVIAAPESEWVVCPSPLPAETRRRLRRRDRWCRSCGGRGYV